MHYISKITLDIIILYKLLPEYFLIIFSSKK